MIFYTYKELKDQLKEHNLPYSRTFLQPLENVGIIKKPENTLMFHRNTTGLSRQEMRIFTQEDINTIIEAVRNYRTANESTTS